MASQMNQSAYTSISPAAAVAASRSWWDYEAQDYLAQHGGFLGDTNLVWGPEGIIEDDVSLLGVVRDLDVLEVGCGAAQGSRWAQSQGANAVGLDLSFGMLRAGNEISQRTHVFPPLVQGDAQNLPFAPRSFDLAFSAFGAIPFVPNLKQLHAEVFRVLRPGSHWVFATSHPIRWAFPDVPTQAGLTASMSYFDRTPYAEKDAHGNVTYVEYHRTMGDHVAALRSAGFVLNQIVEPTWPVSNTETWGGWSPIRGAVIPGTVIFSSQKPAN